MTPKMSLSSETSSLLPPGQHATSHEQEAMMWGRDVLPPRLPSITSWQSHPHAGLQPRAQKTLKSPILESPCSRDCSSTTAPELHVRGTGSGGSNAPWGRERRGSSVLGEPEWVVIPAPSPCFVN